MNLEVNSKENLTYILNELINKLGVANKSLFKTDDYDINKYEELKFMYEVAFKKGKLSPSETEAFLDELKKARKIV